MMDKRGYTLVETVVAALFIGIALITIASAFTNASHILQKSRHTLTAMGYLQNWAEVYRNYSFSNIPIMTDVSLDVSDAPLPSPNLYITAAYYDADNADDDDNDSTGTETDIKKISLRIEWNEAGATITKRMATLITDEGINP